MGEGCLKLSVCAGGWVEGLGEGGGGSQWDRPD